MVTNDKTVQTEYESAFPKKKNNKGILIGIIIAVAIALAVGIGFGIYNSPENRLSRQLDLGQKYLEEQNYEQAIVAFNQAIVLEPMSVEAYMGLADAYIGMGDTEAALEALRAGYEITQSDEIIVRIQEIEKANKVEEAEEPIQVEASSSTSVEFTFTPEDFTFAGFTVLEENYDNIIAALGVEMVWYEYGEWLGERESAEGQIRASKCPDFVEMEGAPKCTRCDVIVESFEEQWKNAMYLTYVPDESGVHKRSISCSLVNPPDIINSPITVGMSREELEEILCIEEIKSKEIIPGGAYDFDSSLGEGWFDILDGGYYEGDVLIEYDVYQLAFQDLTLTVNVLKDEGTVHHWDITSSRFW